jgi:hypothetical protein
LPDLPPDTPETWRVCDGFHADKYGVYRTGWMAASYSDYGSQAANSGLAYRTAAGMLGIVVLSPVIASFKAYVYDGSTWNDRAGGVGFLRSAQSIAQYGNITLVASVGAGGVYSRDATGSSNFASVAGSPPSSVLLVTPQNIVVALYATDGANIGTDGWATSDAGDYTNWATGQAASGNLRQTSGPLTAGVVLGNDVIAFKRHGVYRGQYVGLASLKWKWDLIDPALGAWGAGCAVSAAGRVYFYGDDGFYSYDGASFQKLDAGISSTIPATIGDPTGFFDADNYRALQLVYDSLNRRICFFNFGETTNISGVTRPQHFSYQIDSGAWGYQSRVKDETDDSDDYSGVILNAGELNSFNNGAWNYNSNIALVSVTNTDIRILTTEFTSANCGTNYKPKLRTFRYGRRNRMTQASRFIPNWTLSDGAGTDLSGATVKTATPYRSDSLMESETAGTAVTLSTDQYQADAIQAARFQSIELQINCEACIDGGSWDGKDSGAH